MILTGKPGRMVSVGDLQLALDDLLARLIEGILRPVADGADQLVLLAGSQLRAHAKQRG